MKVLLSITLALLMTVSVAAQTSCKPYIPANKGSKWEVTNYNPKGKIQGKTAYELVEKLEADSATTFTIKSTSTDKKGENPFTQQYKAYCKKGNFEFDMAVMMDPAAVSSYSTMDMDMDATEYTLPSMDAKPGTKLADGKLTVKIGSGGMTMFTMTINVTDRKVEAQEERKTPAGTFKCLKFSQRVNTKMMVKIEASSKEWYAEGVGMVRSESYNKGGKLTGYSELTKLEKK